MNEPNVSASWGNLRRKCDSLSGLFSVLKLRGNLRVSGSTSFRIYEIDELIKNYQRGRICKATPPSPTADCSARPTPKESFDTFRSKNKQSLSRSCEPDSGETAVGLKIPSSPWLSSPLIFCPYLWHSKQEDRESWGEQSRLIKDMPGPHTSIPKVTVKFHKVHSATVALSFGPEARLCFLLTAGMAKYTHIFSFFGSDLKIHPVPA